MQTIVLHIRPDKKHFEMNQGFVKDGQLVGQKEKVWVSPPDQWIPNGYSAYVKKHYNTNGVYTGKFDFVDPMTEGGESIEVRYLENCPSLDKDWQKKNGREAVTDEDLVGWKYPAGERQEIPITPKTELWLNFLLGHDANGTNPFRNEDTAILFIQVDPEAEAEQEEKELEAEIKRLEKLRDKAKKKKEKEEVKEKNTGGLAT